MKKVITAALTVLLPVICIYGSEAGKNTEKYSFSNRYSQLSAKIEQFKKDLKAAKARKRPNKRQISLIGKKIDRYCKRLEKNIGRVTERLDKSIARIERMKKERLKVDPECNVKNFDENIAKFKAEKEFYAKVVAEARKSGKSKASAKAAKAASPKPLK
ncbi:hypothetical protein P0136_00080 [Lentisphaerota bacterium ZTH]|nr:hypothetical protein JYG24_08775 [Lentisphaerota bacterium]WET06414.1 hypothetical protein P0136_00080 [Lentisphaerota bacterium ZTH]